MYATDDQTKRALELFFSYDIDTQLALLWYGYQDIKDELNPAPPSSSDTPSHAIYDRIQALPQDQQLQVQRELLSGGDSEYSREYSAMSSSGRMEVWLLLGQGMENGSIIGFPSDYQLPQQTEEFTNAIAGNELEKRIDFMRSAVMEMGVKAAK